MFQSTLAFFLKAGAKVRTLFHIFQINRKFFSFFFSKEEVSKETASKEKKKVRVLTPFLSECQSIAAPVLESGCKSRGFKDMSQIYLSLFTIKNETFS